VPSYFEQIAGGRTELADNGDGKLTKKKQLEQAGIAERTAERYEQVVSG